MADAEHFRLEIWLKWVMH